MKELSTGEGFKEALKELGFTQGEISDNYGRPEGNKGGGYKGSNIISEKTVNRLLNGVTNLNKEYQDGLIETINKLIKDKKDSINWEVAFDFNVESLLVQIPYEVIYWIENGEIQHIVDYWINFEDLYRWIDNDMSSFIARCDYIKAHDKEGKLTQVDRRTELLEYMKSFQLALAKIVASLSTIRPFLNREEYFKKNISDYKKTKMYKLKGTEQSECVETSEQVKKQEEAYRQELSKKFYKIYFDPQQQELAQLIYRQRGFYYEPSCITKDKGIPPHWVRSWVTDLDDMDWDLLIAYILIKANDKRGKKIAKVMDKLNSLIRQGETEKE